MNYPQISENQKTTTMISATIVFTLVTILSAILIPLNPFYTINGIFNIITISIIIGIAATFGFYVNMINIQRLR